MLMPWATATGQTPVDDLHLVESGSDWNVPSDPYFARTPYTLIWKSETGGTRYRKGKVEKITEIQIMVYDHETGKLIASSGYRPLAGEMKVKVAGKHHIRVCAPGKWTVSYKEDLDTLQRAASRGELKEGVTVEEASGKSVRTRTESVEEAKNRKLQFIDAIKEELGEAGVAAATADVLKAAQLAVDKADFTARYEALNKITMERLGLGRDGNQAPHEKTADSATARTAGWKGKGLPPGMQVRTADDRAASANR